MKAVFLWALLLAAPSFAQEDLGLGPWQLGMTREQVTALTGQGPYKDAASGSLETDKASFAGHKAKATLMFGTTGLSAVKFQIYHGSEWREAEKSALEVFDEFKKKHGGASVKDVADNMDRDALDLILRQTLGTAEAMSKRYAAGGQYMVQTFDMFPVKQPAGVRLHCQWIYDGKSNTYSVLLYMDLPGAPRRDVEENNEIRKL